MSLPSSPDPFSEPDKAINASVNPFPKEVRDAFKVFINKPKYVNRERINYPIWHRIQVFLDNPTIKPRDQRDSRLRTRAYAEFELINRKLYRKSYGKFKQPRYVVPPSEAFDTIANEHLQLLYAGRTKT